MRISWPSYFTDRGVDTDHIQRNEHPTRDVLVTRTLEGDRHFAGFGATSTDDYADCFLNASSLPVELISKSQVLVSGTLGLAYPGSRDAILAAVSAAKSDHNTTVIIDINWRPVFWKDSTAAKSTILDFIKVADVLKLTDEEAEWLYGIPAAEALAQPAKILEALPSVQGVLVSAGEKGSSYSFRCPGGKLDVSGEVAVLPVKVEDTTGAGDAYLSGFIFYMLLSGGLKGLMADPGKLLRAVQFAAACGAATCKRAGAIDAQPTVQEVENLLKEAGLNA